MWNNGSFEPSDPDVPPCTGVNTTSAVIKQIMRVRNLANGTPSRFNLQAGDLCYAQAKGDIQPIINPDGPNGHPAVRREHAGRRRAVTAGTSTTRGSGRAGCR